MKWVAVSQRVDRSADGERRDALDQRWSRFLRCCGYLPLLVPNIVDLVEPILTEVEVDGIILTGGNDLVSCGGDAPERDATERALIAWSKERGVPLLAVCRGMQLLQEEAGIKLVRVSGHVCAKQTIKIDGRMEEVDSFHNWGAREIAGEWEVWATAEDGVHKAIRNPAKSVQGIMWHPERLEPFADRDIELLKGLFGKRRRSA